MEPEQRTKREMTYRNGWKREKIKPDSGNAVLAEPSAKQGIQGLSGKSKLNTWNIRWIWRPVPISLPEGLLMGLWWSFPVLIFAISLWLAYRLSIQS